MEPDGARIARSDKYYWHRYTEVYQPVFASLADAKLVVELGIFHGDSIAWLAERFPGATLVGVDILPVQPDWPVSPRVTYVQADQDDRAAVTAVFANLAGPPDLILEDGSHIPRHQANCLVEGFRRLRPGGLYVLEDICTSHPLTEAFAHYSRPDGIQQPNALHVLLALQHLRDTGAGLTQEIASLLSSDQFFTVSEIRGLFDSIAAIALHKRTKLPLRCYACGGSRFDYVLWRCECGVELYHPTNSMTCLIWKAGPDREIHSEALPASTISADATLVQAVSTHAASAPALTGNGISGQAQPAHPNAMRHGRGWIDRLLGRRHPPAGSITNR